MLLLVDGMRCRESRLALRMSQEECAKRAGIGRRTLQGIEASARHARPETICRLAAVLGEHPRSLARVKGRLVSVA